jgi:hypothetical protein
MRTIQLHHLPQTRLAFPPLPMLLAAATLLPQSLLQQTAAQSLMVDHQLIFPGQILGRQRAPEITVAFLITGHDALA